MSKALTYLHAETCVARADDVWEDFILPCTLDAPILNEAGDAVESVQCTILVKDGATEVIASVSAIVDEDGKPADLEAWLNAFDWTEDEEEDEGEGAQAGPSSLPLPAKASKAKGAKAKPAPQGAKAKPAPQGAKAKPAPQGAIFPGVTDVNVDKGQRAIKLVDSEADLLEIIRCDKAREGGLRKMIQGACEERLRALREEAKYITVTLPDGSAQRILREKLG